MEVININSIKLFNSLRNHNFVGNEIDKYIIDAIYVESGLDDWNKSTLHTKILTYMVSKNENEYAKYLMYLKKSKVINNLNLNYLNIEIKVKEIIKDWRKLTDEINQRTIKQ